MDRPAGGRPLIGVTGPDRGGRAAWWFLRAAILRAGGRARWITPSRPPRAGELDGLIIGGGADVDPALYGEAQIPFGDVVQLSRARVRSRRTPRLTLLVAPFIYLVRRALERGATAGPDPARDDLERGLIDEAVRRDLPILGICRGAQLLNVHFGGSLHQTLAPFYEETPQLWTVLPRKTVELAPESHLAQVIGERPCDVNALHAQAVDALGEGFRVAAREHTGVIQAVEDRDHRFRIGVQWHPEYIPQHRRQRALFEALVRSAA